MAKKKEESTHNKISEINTDEKIDIDISEIKSELSEYVKLKVNDEVRIAVEKANKKLLRYKNSIILKRNITIVILIIVCFFLGYNLYKISNININIDTNRKEETKQVNKNNEEKVESNENNLENLKEKYQYLIDNIYVSEKSGYSKNFYDGDLFDKLKLYLALNNVSSDKVTSEDDSTYLDEEDLKESYENLFEDEFNPKSFEYNDMKFHYLSSKNIFIADGNFEKNSSNIKREIVDIKEDDLLVISTIEGIINDKKLINIVTGEEIKNYKSDELVNYKNKLTKVNYIFSKNDDKYKLSKLVID